jgi:predicted glycosyltransferase
MNVLFCLGHPAHFHLFRYVIKELKEKSCRLLIVIKSKDVLEELLGKESWEYENIYPEERSNSKLEIVMSLVKRDYRLLKISRNYKPDLMIGTSTEIARVGKLLLIPSIVVHEDDANVIINFSRLTYPFANTILSPTSCNNGRWANKTVCYQGYHELAYLHPKYFQHDIGRVKRLTNFPDEKYFIIRFAKLTAHHDIGKKGITNNLAEHIINKLNQLGKVYITSERELEPEFEKYRLKIDPSDMHHVLASASLYIGDSQTMAAEAAVLGIPSIRFNDFVGKLGYLEELEHKYGLTYGVKTSEPAKLIKKIDELLTTPNLKKEWQKRRKIMLSDKIDVTAFMVWFIENYPESIQVMQENSEYQNRFNEKGRLIFAA